MQTARLGLPLLAVAQAQKEITHNEALTLIDALLQPVVTDGPTTTLPSDPASGQCWLVGAGAAGAWAGHDGKMAVWTDGGWRFAALPQGSDVRRISDGKMLLYDGIGWIAPTEIAPPSGGSTVDTEARAVIGSLLSALSALGWIYSP